MRKNVEVEAELVGECKKCGGHIRSNNKAKVCQNCKNKRADRNGKIISGVGIAGLAVITVGGKKALKVVGNIIKG